MKKHLTFLTRFLLAGIFIIGFTAEGNAQSKNHEILLKFQHQKDGKVAKRNAVEQKIYDCTIQGLATQQDIDNFKSKIVGKPLVISVTISEVISGGERNGTIILDRTAKAVDIRELLKGAGISNISIDGELKSVDELGKDAKGTTNTE